MINAESLTINLDKEEKATCSSYKIKNLHSSNKELQVAYQNIPNEFYMNLIITH